MVTVIWSGWSEYWGVWWIWMYVLRCYGPAVVFGV